MLWFWVRQNVFSSFCVLMLIRLLTFAFYVPFHDQPLRNAFRRMGIPHTIVPDQLDSFLSYTVVNYLKKVKQQVRSGMREVQASVS